MQRVPGRPWTRFRTAHTDGLPAFCCGPMEFGFFSWSRGKRDRPGDKPRGLACRASRLLGGCRSISCIPPPRPKEQRGRCLWARISSSKAPAGNPRGFYGATNSEQGAAPGRDELHHNLICWFQSNAGVSMPSRTQTVPTLAANFDITSFGGAIRNWLILPALTRTLAMCFSSTR